MRRGHHNKGDSDEDKSKSRQFSKANGTFFFINVHAIHPLTCSYHETTE